MKKILLPMAIVIALAACTGNNTGETKSGSPEKAHPHESSDAASKAYRLFDAKVGKYEELTGDYKRNFKEDGKVAPEDVTNFDELYKEASKLKDVAMPLVDELDTSDYESFNRDCGYLSDSKIEIQTFVSQHK